MRHAYKLFVLILLILFTSAAQAEQDTVPDFSCDPGEESGLGLAFGGKPISLVSGVESFSRTDLTLGSLYPIHVQRRYNSRSSYDSPLGYGWALNYDKRIYTYPDNSVTLRKECGWKIRFTWSVANGYTPSTGESGSLVQNPDGSFLYTGKYGEQETYDPRGRLTSMADSRGNSLVLTYAGDTRESLWGLLLANIDQTTPLIVSHDYRLSKIEEKDASGTPTGNWVELQYDIATGRLAGITDNSSRAVTFTHDNIGNLTTVSAPSGSATYAYNDPNNKHLLTAIDEGKGPYINQYDTSGRVIKQTHGTGVIDFAYITPYTKTKMTTTIADSSGNLLNTRTRTVEFDGNGQPNKVTDTYGNVRTYTRDSNMWLLREEYWENTGTIETPNLVLRTATNYTYDAHGNALTRTDAQGTALEKTTAYTYDPQFNLVSTTTGTSVVNPGQTAVVTNTYNTNGTLQTTTETGLLGDGTPYSYTTGYAYDSNGRLTSIDGPRTGVQDITTFTYDPVTGNRTTMTQPLIGSTTYSNHDSLGNPGTVTDPNGNSTTYTYDTTGRVLTVKAPGDANPAQYFYVTGCGASCSGKIDHIVLPEGNTIWYTYDTLGNLITITDSQNNTINYTYDSEGNKLTEDIKDPGGVLQKTLSYQYDALNRLKRTTNPDSSYSEYSYDFRGNKSAMRNPNSAISTYTYDALNRLTSVVQPGDITTGYGYDTNNNLTSVADANNNTTQYTYDDKGRVYQVISPDTGTTTYGYDPAGNMVSKTDAKGVTITYQYDALNRLTKIDFPADTDTVYAYDTCVNGKGRLCSMTDASGSTTYEYTPKGQVKKETRTIDTIAYVTQYTYDMNGNIKTMTYPSGKIITYNYTSDRAVNVLNGAATLASSINYKPFGGMSAITLGNGLVGSIGYDNQYRITSITAGTVMNLGYTQYDAIGNIQAINDALDPTKNKAFTYDALDRLSTANASGIWGSLGWTYDGVGNRLTENSNSYTYTPNSNKLSGANGISFGYDNNGNTTTEASRQYIYNQNQRLIQVNDGATTAYYTYNGNGQRVKKNVNGTATIFHYNQSGQIMAESNSSGTITAEYVYLNGQPLAKIEGTDTYYYHNDHLGTPQKMTDASGTVVWAADYKPFGEATITVSTITNNLRFPGQYFDVETGLNYNYFRDYNPAIGRYVEADPLFTQFNHLTAKYINNLLNPNRRPREIKLERHLKIAMAKDNYVYVINNPLKFMDPLGLYEAPPLNTRCAPLYVDSVSDRVACCYRFNKSAGDRCECMGDMIGDSAVTDACKDCNAKFPTSPEQACICACNAAGLKYCDKICKRMCGE